MKTLAIIGASYLQLPLVQKAKEMGLYTICFAWEDGAVCKDITDEFFPISIIEKEQILQICQKKQIDGICTIASDVAAPTVAYIAEKLGLVGNSYESAVRSYNKYQMRNAFVKANVPCPQYICVTSLEEALTNQWLKECLMLRGINTEGVVIVKPSDRSGSLGVMKVKRREELPMAIDNAIRLSFKHEAMVEQFIEGKEISVEFISCNGKHYPLQITDKVTTEAPYFVELEHHQPAELPFEMYERIYAVTNRALTALGITNGASHSEYRITKDGRIYVMEIGARMGGDFIGSDLVQLSTGYDFVKGVIDVALGRFEEPKFTQKKYSGVYFLCEETKSLLPILQNPDQYKEIVKSSLTDTQLRNVTCSAERSGYAIYQSGRKMIL